MTDIPKDIKYEILPDDFTQYDFSFKVIVIGDSGVGKSCITNKATKNIFEENYNATVGFEYFNFNVRFDDIIVKLQIWDTCGQELYRSLITNFYRNSSLAIIVYSVVSQDSFNDIETWLRELRDHSSPDVKVILVGNKIDLESQRKISKEEGQALADKNKMDKFVETSAKTGFNTQELFINISFLLYKDYLKYKNDNESSKTNSTIRTIVTDNTNQKNSTKKKAKTKGGCC